MMRAGSLKEVLLLLVAALAGSGQTLKLGKPVISQFEDGPPIAASQRPVPGETVHFGFIVEGFKATEGKVRITGHAQLFDPRGIAASSRERPRRGTGRRSDNARALIESKSQNGAPTIVGYPFQSRR